MKSFKLAMNNVAYDRFVQSVENKEYDNVCPGIGSNKMVRYEVVQRFSAADGYTVDGVVVEVKTSGAGEYDVEWKNGVYHKVRNMMKKTKDAKAGGSWDALI